MVGPTQVGSQQNASGREETSPSCRLLSGEIGMCHRRSERYKSTNPEAFMPSSCSRTSGYGMVSRVKKTSARMLAVGGESCILIGVRSDWCCRFPMAAGEPACMQAQQAKRGLAASGRKW